MEGRGQQGLRVAEEISRNEEEMADLFQVEGGAKSLGQEEKEDRVGHSARTRARMGT